jgi:hypothetical protein
MHHLPAARKVLLTLATTSAFFTGCTSSTLLVDPRAAGAGRYSAFPTAGGWDRWPPPFLTVVMSHAQYEFEEYHHELTAEGLVEDSTSPTGFKLLPGDQGITIRRESETIRGTGSIVRDEPGGQKILTCLHLVEFPEVTRLEIQSDLTEDGQLLVGIGYRRSQQTFVGRPGEGQVPARLLAYSRDDDLALLSAPLSHLNMWTSSVPYRIGQTDELMAGDGVYILGAPRGRFQVTWGIATPESPTLLHVDTATPPGYSGGLVLATVRETGNLELVGLVTGTAGQFAQLWYYDDTVVSGSSLADADPAHVIAREEKRFDFGITRCVPADRIDELLKKAGLGTLRSRPVEIRDSRPWPE